MQEKKAFGWKLALITNFALGCALIQLISLLELPLFHAQQRKKKTNKHIIAVCREELNLL